MSKLDPAVPPDGVKMQASVKDTENHQPSGVVTLAHVSNFFGGKLKNKVSVGKGSE